MGQGKGLLLEASAGQGLLYGVKLGWSSSWGSEMQQINTGNIPRICCDKIIGLGVWQFDSFESLHAQS